LRNRVLSLIDTSSPKAEILKILAIAMSDPEVKVVDEKGWKIVPGDQTTYSPLISEKGETLIVNQHQLKDLGLISESVTPIEFKKRFPALATTPEKAQPLSSGSPTLQISPEKLMERLKTHIKYNPTGPNTIGHIYIGDKQSEINQATWVYVRSALE